ncbi:protein CHLOROPLAST IMPORT APPARATUS 2-like [Cornus florida]|uniref:protein CHLOROPLAST IMPORT APPARATUS 2-like n=1 Tax=Cornus florida TaxID=4283 RepID=UPI00289FBB9D|nr:protein CHLOROPLAST IMPORT APPARATUS 2-like [Cornus florida]
MCNNNSPSPMLNKPARKIRTKTRKPKFLSLLLELSPENTQQSGGGMTTTTHHQLELFPLHPENLTQEKDSTTHDDNNLEHFFAAADGGSTTLTALLGGSSATTSSEENNSMSLTYAYGGQDSEEVELVRTALRSKERDASEEKWVCYSEVVERKNELEVTSCAADLQYKNQTVAGLSLKLDYQEIMNAWSDKGPLYIQTADESPQTVPDLSDDPNGMMDGRGSNGGLWRVPEKCCSNGLVKPKMEEVQGGEEWKMGQREASVLRYKEKRQNRLFSKRIRYEVRKLNADKRPRVMGRFVKSS